MEILEYNLTLGTGEELSFAEFDPELVPELTHPGVLEASSFILSLCTHVSREIIEKAKIRDMRGLERVLSTPPYGCLKKIDRPICSQIRDCVSADKRTCTTHYLKKTIGVFPLCWSYKVELDDAKYLCGTIVNAWKEGKYVLIIKP